MSMENVLTQYELTEDDCMKKITDKDLDSICNTCSFPYGRMAPHLKVEQACAEDIKQDTNLRSESDRRSSLLKKWKQSKGSEATYKALLSALLGIERREDAEVICKLLKDSKSATPASTHRIPDTDVPATASSGIKQLLVCSLTPCSLS